LLAAPQQIVNTAFRCELADDRSFVVDYMDYRKAKDAELRQMTDPLMSSESIGDAFLKTVVISVRR
jgi:hypothetical protein